MLLKLNLYLSALPKKAVLLFARACCTFFFCCICLFTSAQQVDSFRRVLLQTTNPSEKALALARLADRLGETNLDSSFLLIRQAIALAVQIKNDTALAHCYRVLGNTFYSTQHKDSSFYFLLKAGKLFYKVRDTLWQAVCLLNLGNHYLDDHQYTAGINTLMAARKLAEATKSSEILARIDAELGSAYADQGLYDEGKQYLNASVITLEKLNMPMYLADAYSSYGYIFLQQGVYDSALYYYGKNYAIDKINKLGEEVAEAADNIGTVFYEKANETDMHPWIDSSYKYFLIALNNYTNAESKWNVKYEKINIGSVLRNLKQYKLSEEYLTDAFHYFDSTYDVNYAYMAADELSILYKEINDYKNAYAYKLIGLKYKDTLDKRNRSDSIAQIFARYEVDKKEKEIQLLNTETELDKSTLSRQRILILFSITSLALAAVLFIALINRNRMKQQLKEVKVRNQLAGDLHDEIGSSLSSILLLSKMAADKQGENITNKGMLETIASNTKDVMNKMNDIVWMMNPKYDEGENVREKLEQYVLRVQEAVSCSIQLTVDSKIDTIKFPMETRKTILLLCKEALNNALKYADATTINISLGMENNHIQFIVSDNGNGFNKEMVTNGNGLGIMDLRAKDSKGHLTVQSAPGKGYQNKSIIAYPSFSVE